MPTLSGLATTFNLPNYGGELFLVTRASTPFLSAIGGLSANDPDLLVASTEFTWQTEDLATPAAPGALEGAAPNYNAQTRAVLSNVAQIFQYGVEVSYSKLAASQQLANLGNGESNPVQDELDHQIGLKLKTAARDINWAFLRGTYQKPVDNTTARRTRGLIQAISTNVTAVAGSAPLTEVMVLDAIQSVFDSRDINADMEPTLLVGSAQKRALSQIFITGKNYQEMSRTVGGVNVQAIETDFGTINIMLESAMPSDTVVFTHLGMCKPKFLIIPSKGFLFVEPMAKTGSSEKYELYGEVGLQYGDEAASAKITGLG